MDGQDNITPAIIDIRRFREQIADFLSSASETPREIREHCLKNGWNDTVADDIQHAMFELGHALGTLVLWERDVELTKAQLGEIDGVARGGRE